MIRVLISLIFIISLISMNSVALAEGSKELIMNGGNRPNTD